MRHGTFGSGCARVEELRAARVAARVAWLGEEEGIERLLTKTTFDICNLRLIGHEERMNASLLTLPTGPGHLATSTASFLYFRNSLRVARHIHTDTQTRTLERFASITLRILLVIFAAVIAVELEK